MNDELKYTVSADDSPLAATMRRVQDRFNSIGGGVQNVASGIGGAMSRVNVMLAAVVAVVTGVAVGVKEAVDATQAFTGEANKLARILGVSATEASTLNVALGDIYTDADNFGGAAAKLAKELRTNEEGLRQMGLRTREANGELRPLNDLMMDSIKVVNGYKQGIDRNIAAQALWGKSAEEFTPLLKLNNQVLEDAKKKQEELGLVVGTENVAASKAYKAAMNDVGDVMLAFKKVVGDALLPILTRLGEWFAAIGPTAVFTFRVAFGILATAIHAVVLVLQILWDALSALADPLFTLGKAIRQLIEGDMNGATKTLMGMGESWKNALGGVWDKIKADSARTWGDVQALWSKPTPTAAPSNQGRSAGDLTKKGPEKSLMAQWEAELAALKEANAQKNAENGTFYEFSKEQEKAFWEAKRAIVAAGTQDAYGVQKKVTAATLEIQKDAFEERLAQLRREGEAAEQNYVERRNLAAQELALIKQRYGAEGKEAQEGLRKVEQIERQWAEQKKAMRLSELADMAAAGEAAVELVRQQKQFELDMGLITKDQLLAAERDLEQAKYEIRKQALVQSRELVDPIRDPVEYQRRSQEIEQLERQHQLELANIRNQTTLEGAKNYRDFFSGLQSGFQGVINKFFQSTLTIGGLFKGLFVSLLDALAATAAKMSAEFLIQSITSRVMGKITALSQIASNAAVAGSAAFAATAAIPFVGPELAPAAAAAAYAGAMSFSATLPAAKQGWDIPAGLNPITQLHEKEMVLPEGPADVLREMASQRGVGGGGQQPAGTIRGMPADEWLMLKRDDIVRALKASGRDFNIVRGIR